MIILQPPISDGAAHVSQVKISIMDIHHKSTPVMLMASCCANFFAIWVKAGL